MAVDDSRSAGVRLKLLAAFIDDSKMFLGHDGADLNKFLCRLQFVLCFLSPVMKLCFLPPL